MQHLCLLDWVCGLKDFERFTIASVCLVKCMDSASHFSYLLFSCFVLGTTSGKFRISCQISLIVQKPAWGLSWTSNMGNLEAMWCMRLHGIRLGCILYVPAVASSKYVTVTSWTCLKLHVLSPPFDMRTCERTRHVWTIWVSQLCMLMRYSNVCLERLSWIFVLNASCMFMAVFQSKVTYIVLCGHGLTENIHGLCSKFARFAALMLAEICLEFYLRPVLVLRSPPLAKLCTTTAQQPMYTVASNHDAESFQE